MLVRTATLFVEVDSDEIGSSADLAFACLRSAVRAGATSTSYSVVATPDRVVVTFEAQWSRFGRVRHV